jgi:hypothetical protein
MMDKVIKYLNENIENIEKNPSIIAIILFIILIIGISNNIIQKEKSFKELYKKCKITAPTATYQIDRQNFIIIDNQVYEVEIKKYGLFKTGEKCK